MVHQCAWCLCLIDDMGERISSSPLPKLSEASHGICSVCGTIWLTQAIDPSNIDNSLCITGETKPKASTLGEISGVDCEEQAEFVTQFVLQLQQSRPKQPPIPKGKRHNRIVLIKS